MIDPQLQQIEDLKEEGLLDEALACANDLLVRDPKDKDALYQIADIMYRKGEILKAEKPIDFLLQQDGDDPMSRYIKGVLEMEKTHRKEAKQFLKHAMDALDDDNPEMMRCYALCEYWSGNKEDGLRCLKQAFGASKFDAEIIVNLIELYILQQERSSARRFVSYYYDHKAELQFFDKPWSYYDERVLLFTEYVNYELEKKKQIRNAKKSV